MISKLDYCEISPGYRQSLGTQAREVSKTETGIVTSMVAVRGNARPTYRVAAGKDCRRGGPEREQSKAAETLRRIQFYFIQAEMRCNAMQCAPRRRRPVPWGYLSVLNPIFGCNFFAGAVPWL